MTLRQIADRPRDDWTRPQATVASAAGTAPVARMVTNLPWLDLMLGGGFVRGSVVMIHGAPGSGKSTALLQAAGAVRGSYYLTSEETEGAVAERAIRLRVRLDLPLLAETDIHAGLHRAGRSPLVIVDSIQMMRQGAVKAAQAAVDHARRLNVCVVIVCHEIKEGKHAGPTTIEHIIDCSISLSRNRVISTEKNRFGQAGIALQLEMTDRGLRLPVRPVRKGWFR